MPRRFRPTHNRGLVEAAEKRLFKRLKEFFAERAGDIARQVHERLSAITRASDEPPPEDEEARARRIAEGLELGDWSVLYDPLAEELAEIYASGMRAATRVLGFEEGTETTNEARSRLGLPPVESGGEVPAIVRQVNELSVKWAQERAGELITLISENTRNMLRATIVESIEQGWGANKLADEIAQSAGFSDTRAILIARTETIRAENAGNFDAYKQSGVVEQKEWLITDDDATCQICIDNADQGPIPLDEDFQDGSEFPPSHPNACLSGSSFVPYGRLHQAVRAAYFGPAITIQATLGQNSGQSAARDASLAPNVDDPSAVAEHAHSDFDLLCRHRGRAPSGIPTRYIELTIGPNHPVLTRRGLVAADKLREGDQLLYDLRGEFPVAGIEADFEKVPLFEDAFAALAARFGDVVVSGARDYFHGDQVFSYGEIEVVRPIGDLLPIFDPGLIEHLGECHLTGAYPDAEHVTGCRACISAFDRVFLAAAGSMGGSGGVAPLVGGGILPPPFQVATITFCHEVIFLGDAFDASTESGFYNNGGLVVKNCRCAVLPVVEDGESK